MAIREIPFSSGPLGVMRRIVWVSNSEPQARRLNNGAKLTGDSGSGFEALLIGDAPVELSKNMRSYADRRNTASGAGDWQPKC